ncbi:MAG: hypothetical protein Q8S03_01645 [Brevundimonas sp.]|uniref:hypothetical protein n=1 Tax=Brevundimonas sp. TaxID=1871086 RepID=UPI002735D269|nr:hypothetical protein [Brevundimonas sp.]MDP3403360.1 hypothetical protein [Brevundimonas sp.]
MTPRAATLALLGLAAGLIGCAPVTGTIPDHLPTDYLIQMVCVDAADTPVFADPVGCPDSRRKLRLGEPLPYHKLDVGDFQISDSFPVADANGLTLGVQSYFFTDAFDDDPAFPDQVHLTPARGGYNIMGADQDFVFFRGTSDPGAYWQPWWTPDCRAQGWLLYPNDARAFRRGQAASPTTFAPGCAGRIRTNAATIEWRFIPDHPYVADPADPARTRTLDSIEVRHFSAGYGSMETNYFTREYGATRWEAWRPGAGLTPEFLKARCPASVYQARFHGKVFSMVDCRTWTTLTRPAGGTWDPAGTSAVDPSIRTFPVDPLYTGGNLLVNTHIGGPYEPEGSFTCDERGWNSEGEGGELVFGDLTAPPWQANGSCVRTILATSLPSRDLGQTVDAPRPGVYRFGASLFVAALAPGEVVEAEILLTQRDDRGRIVAIDRLPVSAIDRFRTFEGRVAVRPAVTDLRLSVLPMTANVEIAVTGTYLARAL